MIKFKKNNVYLVIIISLITVLLNSCGLYKKTDRSVPQNALERAKKNVDEGRGISIGGLANRGTTYEFNTSNPLWRASLETLDFLPLANVDYSGGIISTDWYSDNSSDQSLKITIRFLSNEVTSTSLKIIVHEKICKTSSACLTKVVKSKIEEELRSTILSKAASLEKNSTIKK